LNTAKRPLSPHLQVYRPQFTSGLSVLHRATGVMITIGSLLVVWWLWSIMSGVEAYQITYDFFNSLVGKGLLIIWTGCTFYHLCNGIRHLLWDIGFGFELNQAYTTGKIVVAGSIILTMVVVWLICV